MTRRILMSEIIKTEDRDDFHGINIVGAALGAIVGIVLSLVFIQIDLLTTIFLTLYLAVIGCAISKLCEVVIVYIRHMRTWGRP
jgi:integral membrane sensor domain MASE1